MTATVGAPVVAGARWDPPAAIAVRGTLLILPGRGEHAGVYDRFGRRLAVDGYAVRSVAPATAAAAVGEAVAPVVLVGSDEGALHALRLAATLAVDGAIVAGTPWSGAAPPSARTAPELRSVDRPNSSGLVGRPTEGSSLSSVGRPTEDGLGLVGRPTETGDPGRLRTGGWDAELEARSACPTHQARLTGDTGFRRGALTEPLPAGLRESVDPGAVAVPVLVVHGEADPVTPVDAARALAAALPQAELATVRAGRHDALNDITHRTVAAHVVLWLERLRADRAVTPILTVTRPA
ncbi:alpha/beta hydrolase [Dactylosporangium sucinum]|uniref:Peptidase S33 tripeptidyl aminopeptidase-like C-terminal domain-containing protein n=1 Tax=Dactylosporangium sucinum TaxID=1424081 RepID=A0A917T2G8_9ACTN|nr:alpha/beta hydrolase [Dactylosporangium sucinum]GGM08247.1 hypothetical protein GCM10007977_006570 [Dactylosporangium sucinum]